MVREKYSKRCLLLSSGLVEKKETCREKGGCYNMIGQLFNYNSSAKVINGHSMTEGALGLTAGIMARIRSWAKVGHGY